MDGFSKDSLAVRRPKQTTAYGYDAQFQRKSLLNPVSVSKGTVLATLGGLTEVRDITGGTVLFTIDPTTGTVTIAGGVVANQTLNLGTVNNTALTGTINNAGTLSLGIGSAGTVYNSVFSTGTISSSNFSSGSILFSYFSQGTLDAPRISNVSNYDVNIGSQTLNTSGDFQLQAYGSAVNIVINLGGTTFRFNPTGTI